MNVVRSIWSDLVEKKLWPVAAALVVALVAIPLALTAGGEDAAPVVAPGGAVAKPAAPVSLDETVSDTPKVRKGGVRDPFRQLHVPRPKAEPKGAASASPSAATPTPGGGATITPGVAPANQPDAPGAGSPVAPRQTGPSAGYYTYRVSLRFGRPGKLKSYDDVKRLTALPSSTFPFFTFMGVLEDQNTAVFLVSADVTARGDVRCRPSSTRCQMLELKPGDSVLLTYRPTDGREPIRYRLELKRVKQVDMASKAKAAKANAAVNRRGAAALKAMRTARLVPQVHRYTHSARTGLLRRARRKASAARVPARVSLKTKWGRIAKANGGVMFLARKSARRS